REAAEICSQRLHSMELALPALEKAVGLVPVDRSLRLMYADALLTAGLLDRAQEVLDQLLKESGRRRSRERAGVHHLLAKVARAQKNLREALAHLEQASEMDMDNAGILQTLAEVAEEAADSDRAERAYRALILLLRREGSGARISSSEV